MAALLRFSSLSSLLVATLLFFVVAGFHHDLPVSFLSKRRVQKSTTFSSARTVVVLQQLPWKQSNDDLYHRVDVIDAHPDVANGETTETATTTNIQNGNGAVGSDVPLTNHKVRRYYETFVWKKNDMTGQDYNINYRVEGPVDGHPILLVHGFGANVNHFRFQFPALVAEGYRVYAVDLLGFGASDKPKNANYSIELFVQLLRDFVVEMNQQSSANNDSNNQKQLQWIVAGNSIGGLCSLGLADKLPDVIKGVVLFNTSGGMNGFRYEQFPILIRPILWFVQRFIFGNPKRGGSFFEKFKTRENVERILMTQGVYGNTTNVDEELLEILVGPADDEGARDVFLKVFGGDPGPTPESFFSTIECPVLALWGEADPWTVIAMGETFGKYAKKYRLERLPGAGHCPHDEAPELVHEIMLPWLREVFNDVDSTSTSSNSQNNDHDGDKMKVNSSSPAVEQEAQ